MGAAECCGKDKGKRPGGKPERWRIYGGMFGAGTGEVSGAGRLCGGGVVFRVGRAAGRVERCGGG
jgi:hypothetical protein